MRKYAIGKAKKIAQKTRAIAVNLRVAKKWCGRWYKYQKLAGSDARPYSSIVLYLFVILLAKVGRTMDF